MRYPSRALRSGDVGWTQRAAVLITGLLTRAFARGVWRRVLRHPPRLRVPAPSPCTFPAAVSTPPIALTARPPVRT